MQTLEWHTEKRKVRDLIPWGRNPREMTEKQAKDLQTSLEKFNLMSIPVINNNNLLISGHQRVNILKLLKRENEEIDVRVPNRSLTDKEVEEANIRENKNLGQWDFDALANFDEELLKNVGFESQELDKIFQLDTTPEEDDVPEIRPHTAIMNSDIFQLGEHRLLCGDATKIEDVERLMDGEKADMVFTDPPYNVGKDYKGEELDTKEFSIFHNNWISLLPVLVRKDGAIYIFSGIKWLWEMAESIRLVFRPRLLIWYKPNSHGVGDGNYFFNYEAIFYGSVGGKITQKSYEGEFNRDVWVSNKAKESEGGFVHSTTKPVLICESGVIKNSTRGNIILDLFGGSGSTLIACEKLNRKCRMMEIAPIYCQVIIDRWEKFTGKKAIKANEKT